MIEPGLVEHIRNTVPGLMDDDFQEERIFPVMLPQSVRYPAITYWIVSDPRLYTQNGMLGLVEAVYRIEVWDTVYERMKETSQALRLSLGRFRGPMGTVVVAFFQYLGGPELFDNSVLVAGDEAPGVHRHAADYRVLYDESPLLV